MGGRKSKGVDAFRTCRGQENEEKWKRMEGVLMHFPTYYFIIIVTGVADLSVAAPNNEYGRSFIALTGSPHEGNGTQKEKKGVVKKHRT